MTVAVTYPIVQDTSAHFGIPEDTTGRNGQQIAAICLHVLELTAENYIAYSHSLRHYDTIRPDEHGSVHYLIGADGTIRQLLPLTDTAWAIQDLNNPTWGLVDDFSGVNLNYVTINIGVEQFLSNAMPTNMFRSLAELVAKLCEDYEIDADSDHIISHSMLDDTFENCGDALATNLIATVQSILAQQSDAVTYDVSIIQVQLAALQVQVGAIENTLDTSLEMIQTYAAHVTTEAASNTLGHVKTSDTIQVEDSAAVTQTLAAAYKLSSGTQTVTLGIPAIVQFPTVIFDDNDWVALGALQKVRPDILGAYRMRARVQFSPANWSTGKYIQLDIYKNGVLLETIAYKVIEAGFTSKAIEIAGECQFVQSVATDYYDVRVTEDDTNGLKTIASGNFVCEHIGG